jgi:hypothetical protein
VGPEITSVSDLESLCFNQVAEGLQLEFKQKEDPSTAVLSKTDQKAIAETISAFANSDGGTLIYGVKTFRKGAVDSAAELVPICDVADFANNVGTVSSLNVSPQVPHVSTRTILVDDRTGEGVLICEVPRSDRRPHMSTAPNVHRYYRRSFEGTVPMTPSEVRDQILAVRDAILDPVVTYPAGGGWSPSSQWISASVPIVFSLKNIGRALCKNPFLRVKGSVSLHSHSATYDGALQAWKTMFPDGTMIHVDDQQTCLSLSLNACILSGQLACHFSNHSSDLTDSVLIFPGSSSYDIRTITDKESLDRVDLHLRFGAENAPVADQTVTFSRAELVRGILGQETVKQMHRQNWGAWNDALVEQYCSQSAV